MRLDRLKPVSNIMTPYNETDLEIKYYCESKYLTIIYSYPNPGKSRKFPGLDAVSV